MRIVFFNEILGTNENQVEDKKQEFLKRFENSLKFKNDFFYPGNFDSFSLFNSS